MRKKGFTLVELAIVLVVIGMILGMAIKGKSLIDSARLKEELVNINKMQAAVVIYMSKLKTPPLQVIPAAGVLQMEPIYATGIITEKNTISKIVDSQWEFQACREGTAYDIGFEKNKNANSICISIRTTASYACYMETGLDDDNYSTGDGRGVQSWVDSLTNYARGYPTKSISSANPNFFGPCEKSNMQYGKGFEYAYRVW